MINNTKFNEVLANFKGSKNQLKLYVYLVNWDSYTLDMYKKHFEHFQTAIANELHIKDDRIKGDIDYLVTNNYIIITDGQTKSKGRSSKVFEVTNDVIKITTHGGEITTQFGKITTHGGEITTHGGGHKKRTNNNNNKDNTYNISTYIESEETDYKSDLDKEREKVLEIKSDIDNGVFSTIAMLETRLLFTPISGGKAEALKKYYYSKCQ